MEQLDLTHAELIELAVRNPIDAVRRIALALRSEPSAVDRPPLLYARGLAERETGNVARAAATFTEAIARAEEMGQIALRREIQTSIAPVLLMTGTAAEAFAALDAAADGADPESAAIIECQRAGLYVKTGDPSAALACYERSLPVLDDGAHEIPLANGLANRGILATWLGRPLDGTRDFTRARDIYIAHGNALDAADMTRNLGFAAVRHGDIPSALSAFDDADADLAGQKSVTSVGLDRAEALLAVGLADEAAAVATATAAKLEKFGDRSAAAEGRLLAAQALALNGEPDRALQAAIDAAEAFARTGMLGWAAVARYEWARARFSTGHTHELADIEALLQLVTTLEETGQPIIAAHTRCLARRLAVRVDGAVVNGGALTHAHDTAAGFIPVDLQVHEAIAEVEEADAVGEPELAQQAIERGFRSIRRAQALLGASDARAHVALHAAELSQLDLALATRSADPVAVLCALERSRHNTLARPVLPPRNEELARALDELRAVDAELRTHDEERGDRARLVQRHAELEARIRRHALHASGTDGDGGNDGASDAPGLDMAALQARLGDARLVAFGVDAGQYVAVAVTAATCALHRLDLGVGETEGLVSRLRFALDHAARHDERGTYVTDPSADLLSAALAPALGDSGPLVVLPTGPLANVPLRTLRLLGARPFTVTPSVTHLLSGRSPASFGSRNVVFAAGPRLTNADREVLELGRRHAGSRVLTSSETTTRSLGDALTTATTLHLACHGRFRDDNPLFSALELADGPMTVYDIERLDRTPSLVVLSACEVASTTRRPGAELLGLSSALISLGTEDVIAATSLLPDTDETVELMVRLHDALATGRSPAVALAHAQRDAGNPALGALTCVGTGA